jgi:hypothetical protein
MTLIKKMGLTNKVYDKGFYEDWFGNSYTEDDIGYQNNAKYLHSVIPKKYLDTITKVAEIGGCTGGNLFYLGKYKHFQTLDNYELSEDAINIGKERYVGVNQINVDILKETTHTKYDLMLLSDIVEHFKDDLYFLEKVKSKTEYIALKMPIEKSIYTQLKRYLSRNPVLLGENHPSGHYHEYTIDETLTLVKKYFEIINYFPYNIQQDKKVLDFNNAMYHQNKMMPKILYAVQRFLYICLPLSVYIYIFGGNVFLFAKTKNGANNIE